MSASVLCYLFMLFTYFPIQSSVYIFSSMFNHFRYIHHSCLVYQFVGLFRANSFFGMAAGVEKEVVLECLFFDGKLDNCGKLHVELFKIVELHQMHSAHPD